MQKLNIWSNGQTRLSVGLTEIMFGSFTSAGNNANQVETVQVSFPASFGDVPCVQCTVRSAAPYTKARNVTVADKSTTGFNAYVLRTDNNPETINYVAIGRRGR